MLDSAQEILENICVHLRIMTSAMTSNGHVCVQNTNKNIFWCEKMKLYLVWPCLPCLAF